MAVAAWSARRTRIASSAFVKGRGDRFDVLATADGDDEAGHALLDHQRRLEHVADARVGRIVLRPARPAVGPGVAPQALAGWISIAA
jgi:hypothetical protein